MILRISAQTRSLLFASGAAVAVLLASNRSPSSIIQLTAQAADVPPVVALKAVPFALSDVRLLDGPFQRDVDRLLHNFRVNAGLPSSAQPLGGWEEPKCELRGHFVGHYLSACALMYASTGDQRLKDKGDQIVAGLAECQQKLGNGYLSAFPLEYFDRLKARTKVWAPFYTIHKIMAGMYDMHEHCSNKQA